MRDAEAVAYRLLHETGLLRPATKLLGSPALWRASGLLESAALFATGGSAGSIGEYVESMEKRWAPFDRWFTDAPRALDFGTGLGGNLLGLRGRLGTGLGIDLNPFYITRARRLAERYGARQLRFEAYDGVHLPFEGPYDVILCTGTFERLRKPAVAAYVRRLALALAPNGRFLAYFLTAGARAQGFGRLLGQESYVFWAEEELAELLRSSGLELEERIPRFPTSGDLLVMRRRSAGVRPGTDAVAVRGAPA
ncbi:MAG: class I SAM-dependent methyltransferase [Thermoplasmata archaeon]|nr:class I SAM-dependent methyltransferase [Thermoplasmata archaeon]